MYVLTQIRDHDETITIYETNELYGEMGRFRVMSFHDDAVQGVLDLRDPARIVLEYPKAMLHLMNEWLPSFQHIFLIGYGTGTIARALEEKGKNVMAVDISSPVIELSRAYFYQPKSNVQLGDGRAILEHQPAGSMDYILIDAFTASGIPYHLSTYEFFALVQQKLAPHGILMMNVIGRPDGDYRVQALADTMGAVFEYTHTFALHAKQVSIEQNMLLIASAYPLDLPSTTAVAGFYPTALIPMGIVQWD